MYLKGRFSTLSFSTFQHINVIFYFVDDEHLANYADDNTPHTTAKDIDTVLNYLANETYILIKWFDDNYFKLNGDKCKLLVSNNDENTFVVIDGHRVTGQRNVKLLGIKIDNKLNFNDHVSMIYKKASHKLHALARISPFMNKNKLRVLTKAFIESQFGYCPLIWMFHSGKLINKITFQTDNFKTVRYGSETLAFRGPLIWESVPIDIKNSPTLAILNKKLNNGHHLNANVVFVQN